MPREKDTPGLPAPEHPQITADVLQDGVAPGEKRAGGDERVFAWSPPPPARGTHRGSHLLAAGLHLRTCASAQLARSRQGRTCRRPAASPGSRAWSLVPGPWSWQPRGWEQALPRTLSLGQTHRFPAPTISSARRVGTARNQRGHGSPKPLWHGSPAKLFVAEWVTEGTRGARAPRSVPALWGCGFPVSLLRGVKQARSGELPVSPSAEDAREQSADTRDWAGANAKETA